MLADPPRPGACLPGLHGALGPERCAKLQQLLIDRAARWAEGVAPGRAIVSVERVDREPEATRRAREAVAAFERHGCGSPLLMAFAGLPRLRAEHAEDALGDLNAGADVSFGPSNDGGYYLLAMARPLLQLFDIPEEVWDGPLVLPRTIELAAEHGLEGGLLRMERVLATPADALALLADPLTPPQIRAILEASPIAANEKDAGSR